MNSYCSIYVTYNPYPGLLRKVISSSSEQVEKIHVIDNGSLIPTAPLLAEFTNIEVIPLEENIGIAAAINVGIKRAHVAGYRYVLLLDQDSVIPRDMISQYSKWL